MENSLLKLSNFKLKIGDNMVLQGDFILKPGEVHKLNGRSGSGKTTFLKTLARLHPLESGDLYFSGQNSRTIAPTLWRRKIGYLAQNPKMLPGSVEDNLKIPFQFSISNGRNFDPHLAAELLTDTGLSADLLKADAALISGGEASRVALIRTLLCQPQVILADEITAPLDPESADNTVKLLMKWLKREQRGLVVVAHQSQIWEGLINRSTNLDDLSIQN
jgi:putative ABC transport system ATP-binding protein